MPKLNKPKQKGGDNMGKASTAQRGAKGIATDKGTILRGKVLEYTMEQENPYQSESSNIFCACGSGGGCSGGYDRRAMSR